MGVDDRTLTTMLRGPSRGCSGRPGTAGTSATLVEVAKSVSPHGVEFAERAMRGFVTGYGKRARFRLSIAR